MKPAPFGYERPRDLEAALAALAQAGASAKIIAGGQSLGPMLNLRLVEPELVIDITAIDELKHAGTWGEELVLGACITHADIEDGRIPDVTRGAMKAVAANIAYRAVRNRGTIGGSISHADPSSDWVSALSALGATLTLRGPAGARRVAMNDFVTGALESCLHQGEMVVTIHVPKRPTSAHWGYVKSCRKTGEFAHALCAVMIDPDIGFARIVIGAIDAAPIAVANAEKLFGGRIGSDYKARFDPRAADGLLEAAGVADRTHRHIHLNVLSRAIREAA
jgi:aerobic carbon-monoxide dehydrogenase medium subunit